MIPLIERLVALLNELRPTARTRPNDLHRLLRMIAASVIQEDATQAQIPPGDWPREVVEAIDAGARLATDLTTARKRLRVVSEVLPLATPASRQSERPAATFGPFVDQRGIALRFRAYRVVRPPAGCLPPFRSAAVRL